MIDGFSLYIIQVDEKSQAKRRGIPFLFFFFTQSVAEIWITREKSGNTTKPCLT